MADLTQILERINALLQDRKLERIQGNPQDPETLFTAVLRSIWKHPDKQQRENIAFSVMNELKKYFGGKKMEDIYTRTVADLEASTTAQSAQQAEKASLDKKKDPNYVPSFDELFGK